MSPHELHLTYFPLRARGEPILLLLVDSGVPFTLEEVVPQSWAQWRKSGKITRDVYPFSALPVLRVRDGSVSGKDFVLAETSAILSFLEEILAPDGTPVGEETTQRSRLNAMTQLLRDVPLKVRVSAEMIKEASLFFLARMLETSSDKDWLAPPKREKLWRGLVTRFLSNTDGALSDLNKSISVVPSAAESLRGYTVAVATAINLITDVFPRARTELRGGGQYELCGRVWAAVRERARTSEYLREVQGKPWTISEWTARAAKL